MARFTRNRGQKRLRARRANGRFRRTTLQDIAPGMAVCDACGRFYEAVRFEGEPFPMPVRVASCPHCGASVSP